MREAWHVLEPTTELKLNWHQDAIADHLEAIHRGEITRLQINQPPGSMKSTIVSVLFQAWEWGPGGMPGLRFFTTSYAERFARRDSRKTRDLILSEWYRTLWPEIDLVRDGETDFENTFHGNRMAVPFKSLTAGRGNRLLIDDPHSTEQAESDAERESATRKFRESATSRLNDPARDAILVIMHRLHPKDLCGVIEELDLPYVKLVLPMEYHRSLSVVTPWFTDPRSDENELLCPALVPRETVEQNKKELGSYAFATQFQQQAQSRAGSNFFSDEHLLIEGLPAQTPRVCDVVYAVIDSAMKDGQEHDGTSVVYCAFAKYPEPMLWIVDYDIVQIEGSLLHLWVPQVYARLAELTRECNTRVGSIGVYVEDRQSGTILLQHGRRTPEWAMRPLSEQLTKLGKEGRALSVSGYVYTDKVKITQAAYDKVVTFKGRTMNWLWSQVMGFRIGAKNQADDLFDGFCYSVAIAHGNEDGF